MGLGAVGRLFCVRVVMPDKAPCRCGYEYVRARPVGSISHPFGSNHMVRAAASTRLAGRVCSKPRHSTPAYRPVGTVPTSSASGPEKLFLEYYALPQRWTGSVRTHLPPFAFNEVCAGSLRGFGFRGARCRPRRHRLRSRHPRNRRAPARSADLTAMAPVQPTRSIHYLPTT